jgi:hypothetical protein
VADGELVSTREVLREIEDGPIESLIAWAWDNEGLFAMPTRDEGAFVAKIYGVLIFSRTLNNRRF